MCFAPIVEFAGSVTKGVVGGQGELIEAEKNLPDLVEAAIDGEDVIITKNDQPVVKLVPVDRVDSRRKFGSARGLITFSEDFDKPIEDFNDYLR